MESMKRNIYVCVCVCICLCVCITESLFCTAIIQHCESTILPFKKQNITVITIYIDCLSTDYARHHARRFESKPSPRTSHEGYRFSLFFTILPVATQCLATYGLSVRQLSNE